MKRLSEAARAAKEIRKILKKNFPNTKFRVRSDNFSMGDSVDVSWVNGPTHDSVANLINHFQYGHFNSMEDMYEHSNFRKDIPQAKFVQCQRRITEEKYNEAFRYAKSYIVGFETLNSMDEYTSKLNGTARHYLWRVVSTVDFSEEFTFEKFKTALFA